MRVLVVSEGKHERAGALESLLRQLGGNDTAIAFEHERMSNNAVRAWHGTGLGHFKRAVGWLKEAEKRRVDALILLIDDDKKPKEKRNDQIMNAQNSTLSALPRAMGVAIRTFDAWMLADEKALSCALGCTIKRQSDPESINDPKSVCASLLAKGKSQMAQSKMYAMVASRLDITVLAGRCPSGFKPFAERVQRVFVRGPVT